MAQLVCLDPQLKAAAVKASHSRSREYGIDPNVRNKPPLTPQEIDKRVRAQQAFFTLAAEQIKMLRGMLNTDHFYMAVADADGYLLHIDGGRKSARSWPLAAAPKVTA